MSIVGDQQKVGHFVPKTCQIFKVCLSPSICMGSTSSSLYSVIYLYHHQILTNNWINVTFALWYRFFFVVVQLVFSSINLCVCFMSAFSHVGKSIPMYCSPSNQKKKCLYSGCTIVVVVTHCSCVIANCLSFLYFYFQLIPFYLPFFFRTASLPWSQSFHFISCSLYILLVSAFNVQMRRQIFQFGFQWSMPLDCRLLRLIVIFHCVVYPSL